MISIIGEFIMEFKDYIFLVIIIAGFAANMFNILRDILMKIKKQTKK